MQNLKKVTIYSMGGLGQIIATEGHLISYEIKKYAQFDAVPSVKYIKKKCRNKEGFVCAQHNPFLVIVEGWNKVKPADVFTGLPANVTADVTATAYDGSWAADFKKQLDAAKDLVYIAKHISIPVAEKAAEEEKILIDEGRAASKILDGISSALEQLDESDTPDAISTEEVIDASEVESPSFKNRALAEPELVKPVKIVSGQTLKITYNSRFGFIVEKATLKSSQELLLQLGFKYWEPCRVFCFPGTKGKPRTEEIWAKVAALGIRLDRAGIDWYIEKETLEAFENR